MISRTSIIACALSVWRSRGAPSKLTRQYRWDMIAATMKVISSAATAMLLLAGSSVEAQVTRLEIATREAVSNGRGFGAAGTYLGRNVQAAGFFKGQLCGFTGGYVPFAVTRAERLKAGDPRPSLEERYGTQGGYACVVRRAAQSLVRDRFMLKEDADRVIAAASNAHLLPPASESDAAARDVTARLCR
jgi:Alpha/beta hydrolase domain